MRSITLVTAPTVEPVTLAEAKTWARVDGTAEDAVLAALIATSRTAVEEFLRRSLISQTWKLTLDLPRSPNWDRLGEGVYDMPASLLYGDLPRSIVLPKGPVQSITSVVTYDTANDDTTYDSGNYFLDSAGDRLVLNDTAVWPGSLRERAAVAVTYVTGYGAGASNVPQPIRSAILMHIAGLYDSRGQCEDQMDLPPGAKQLLKQYRVMGERYG